MRTKTHRIARFFTCATAVNQLAFVLQALVVQGLTIAGLTFTLASLTAKSAVAEEIPEPDGYRLEEYDAPVPAKLTGATLVDALDVKQFLDNKSGVVFDVIPEHRKPDFLPENQIWIPPEHKGIPGSVWLPDIGYGVLSEVTTEYFKKNIEKSTDSNFDFPIVFYCRLDCWMSWNAAKRALTFGYSDVYWFADGIEGWTFEDFELVALTPEPGKRQ